MMILAVMWKGRNRDARTMRLPKLAGCRFLTLRGRNPVSIVCCALGCDLLAKGTNINGKQTNVWSYPAKANGNSKSVEVQLSPTQFKRWDSQREILLQCQEVANPATKIVREVLSRTSESDSFKSIAAQLSARGEIATVKAWRKSPQKVTLTKDGDILPVIARLPQRLRQALLIDGRPVVEWDIKSAHAVLLAMFYLGRTDHKWMEERSRFIVEANAGFPALYGDEKQHKIKFLAALNQSALVATHASHGYRELKRLFPLLQGWLAQMSEHKPKGIGSRLRSTLASIMRGAVLANYEAGVPCLPVTDALVVPADADHEAVAQRIREPIRELTGITPLLTDKTAHSSANARYSLAPFAKA